MQEFSENNNEGFPKKSKKKLKKDISPFPEVDKETFEYFQRVKEGLESQEFEDEEEKSKFFWVKQVPGRGPEQRESGKTVLYI